MDVRILCETDISQLPSSNLRTLSIECSNITLSHINPTRIQITDNLSNITLSHVSTTTCVFGKNCHSITLSDCSFHDSQRGPAVFIPDGSEISLTRCEFSENLVDLSLKQSVPVSVDPPSPISAPGISIDSCSLASLVLSIDLAYPDEYPAGKRLESEISLSSLCVKNTEISRVTVCINGHFRQPLLFSRWPPDVQEISIPRRGRAGIRKCRVSVTKENLKISEDPRDTCDPIPPRKRRKTGIYGTISGHLEILGLETLPVDISDVLKAFRRKALEVHPDKNASDTDAFLRLSLAKDALTHYLALSPKR